MTSRGTGDREATGAAMWWTKESQDPHTARLEGDWSGLLEDLEADPANNADLRQARAWGRRHGIFLAPDKAMRLMLPRAFSTLRDGFERVHGPEVGASLRRARAVATLTDDPCAQTNVRRDPPIISISSGFIACGNMLAGAWHVLASEDDPAEAYASLAALRFYALQQVFFGLSAVHTLRARSRSAPDVVLFTMAHEMSHVALGHTVAPSGAAHQELEADRFGWPVLRMASIFNRQNGIDSALLSVINADFVGRYPYIRPPSSHPTLAARISNLAELDQAIASRGEQLVPLIRLVEDAADLTRPLPPHAWDALEASQWWETGRRQESSYVNIRHYDAMMGLERNGLLDLLERMRLEMNPHLRLASALSQVRPRRSEDLVAALDDLGVGDAQLWVLSDEPVGLDLLVEEFVRCRAWDELAEGRAPEDRVIQSTLAALVVRSYLMETKEDADAR